MISFQDPTPYANPETPDKLGQLTMLASSFGDVDTLFYFVMATCVFFFVLITVILGYSVIRYRRRTEEQPAASNTTHHTMLEVVWTVIPLIIVMVIFAWGWKGMNDMSVAPRGARQYKAVAKQWNWTFFYPNDPSNSVNELWVEVGKPAAFTLESTDVLHSFFIPSMRVKRDVVPGRLNTLWFEPTQLGTYHMFCTEYCGKDHSVMYAKVHVVTKSEYEKRPWDQEDPNPVVNGQRIYSQLCKACHTIDGTKLVGPSFKGLWGSSHAVQFANGSQETITVDEAYVLESIRNPNLKKQPEYLSQAMTQFDAAVLPDRRVNFLIEYLKTLAASGSQQK